MEAPLPMPPVPPRGGGVLKWMLLGCGMFVVLGAVGAGVGAYFLISAATGTEIASAPASVGQESVVTYQVAEAVPHALWLEYDVAFQGGDYHLEGPISIRTNAQPLVQDTLTLGPEGAPTAAGYGRVTTNSRIVNMNGQGSASARIRLTEIPAQPPGTVVTAGVAVSPRSGTIVNGLRLVVTR